MEQRPPTQLRFAEVDVRCRAALAAASRYLSRNERYTVEVILDLTYALGFAQLAVTCAADLSDALELGGRQNVNTLFHRLGVMNILRWDEATGSPSINPDPQTWLVRPSIPVSVERASRATAARARLLAHQRNTSAQGEFFPVPTVAEWEAEAAQERASSQKPSEASATPLSPEKRHNSYDEKPGGCHNNYDAQAPERHRSYDTDAPRVAPARSDARQNHGSVAESNHVHGSDAREVAADLTIAQDLERFFVEVGLPANVIVDYRRSWMRKIIERPLKVRRCLDGAMADRAAGFVPNKTWGHYLDYLYKLGQTREKAQRTTNAPTRASAPTAAATVEGASDEQRQQGAASLRQFREASAGKGAKT